MTPSFTSRTLAHAGALALALALSLPVASAFAADGITDALQQAYAPYRVALSRTNSAGQAEAAQAMAAARKGLTAVIAQWGARPAAPYDRDPAFAATLSKVDEVYARAQAEIAANDLPRAHVTLEAARELLADLRQRNGVVVYSDHMNAYHEVMEQVLGEGPKLVADTGGLIQLAGQVGVLDYLAGRLDSQADAALKREPEFVRLLAAVRASTASLQAAVRRQDAAAVRDALQALKKPYSQLFVKFG